MESGATGPLAHALAALCLAFVLSAPTSQAGAAGGPASALALELPADLPASARAEDALDRDEARLAAHLLLHPDRPDRVGVLFEVDPGWHLYWRNPGDSGLATEIEFRVGDGEDARRVDTLAWPTPASFGEDDGEGQTLMTYGYGDRVLLTARFDAELAAGEVLHAEVRALVCERQCIPATFSLSRGVPDHRETADTEQSRALFRHFAAALPVRPEAYGARVEALWAQSALRPGDRAEGGLVLTSCAIDECVPLRLAAEPVNFFPAQEDIAVAERGRHPLADGAGGDAEVLALEASVEDEPPARLRGVLVVTGAEGARRGLEIDLPLATAAAGSAVDRAPLPWDTASTGGGAGAAVSPSAEAAGGLGVFAVLWLAFAGGLILNLMPCVLPVLAIKVFSVADLAHRRRREVLTHGAAYSAGILVTMAVLAGVVIALRSAGHSVGWGFQFQEPLFVAFVCSVVVVFALNLLGVFEISFDPGRLAEMGAEAAGARRSFFEGLLAVVLATPCSAPFLGTAVGFAFSSSALEIFGVFLAIGAGLAAPYALVTAIPAWSRIIPRPGPWMVKLRAGLGFLLLASAVWLVWVLGRSAGLDAATNLLAFLLFVSFLAWIYGGLPAQRPAWVSPALASVLVAVALVAADGVEIDASADPAAAESRTLGTAYDRRAMETELAAGRSVFAYFTADWCITCKVNERRVLAQPEVRDELARRDVAVFRGDWTQRDEAIRSELARYGKAGVPVYVVRHPGADDPIVLPELLSAERLFAALSAGRP